MSPKATGSSPHPSSWLSCGRIVFILVFKGSKSSMMSSGKTLYVTSTWPMFFALWSLEPAFGAFVEAAEFAAFSVAFYLDFTAAGAEEFC